MRIYKAEGGLLYKCTVFCCAVGGGEQKVLSQLEVSVVRLICPVKRFSCQIYHSVTSRHHGLLRRAARQDRAERAGRRHPVLLPRAGLRRGAPSLHPFVSASFRIVGSSLSLLRCNAVVGVLARVCFARTLQLPRRSRTHAGATAHTREGSSSHVRFLKIPSVHQVRAVLAMPKKITIKPPKAVQ